MQLIPSISQQEIPSVHVVRSEARSAGEWRALKREWYCQATCSLWSKTQGEAMALCIWSCACSGCGDDCRKPHIFVLTPQTLPASLCRSIMNLVWSGNYVSMPSGNCVCFSIPSLYKTDLNQKIKPSHVFILLTQLSSQAEQGYPCSCTAGTVPFRLKFSSEAYCSALSLLDQEKDSFQPPDWDDNWVSSDNIRVMG